MKIENWFFVYDGPTKLAAFPNAELAEHYAQGSDWKIIEREVVIGSASGG
jgi:hypothetical protein